MAGPRGEPADHLALHPDQLLVAKHGTGIFFGIITRQAIRRGPFRLVRELTAFIDAYNDRCQPFTWTKDADQLLAKIIPGRQRTNATQH